MSVRLDWILTKSYCIEFWPYFVRLLGLTSLFDEFVLPKCLIFECTVLFMFIGTVLLKASYCWVVLLIAADAKDRYFFYYVIYSNT